MNPISPEGATEILSELIMRPSVNPMGGGYAGDEPVEREVSSFIETLFTGTQAQVHRDTYGPLHENLCITLPGTSDGPALLFESHADTVPADDWGPDAFRPKVEGGLLYGRGACDDKGSLASMVMAVLSLLDEGTAPPRPVILLVAGDEEYAQTGIKRFRQGCPTLSGGVFGEPTGLRPLVQHKGTVRWDISTHGRSAHTSMRELGHSAIDDMLRVIEALREHESRLSSTHSNPLMTGPTVTVTMISGGRTRNAVPDLCRVAVDVRVLPGMDPAQVRQDVIDELSRLGPDISHGPVQLMTPPLDTSPEDPFPQRVLDICRAHAGPDVDLQGAPYGTDAAWVSDMAPAVVLGPGSIDSAHAVGEHVPVEEVVTCARIYREIMLSAAPGP